IVPRLKFPRPGLRIVCIRLESRQNTSRNVDSRQRIKPGQRGGGRDFTESPIPTFGRLCTVENAAWGSRGAGMDLAAPGLCTLRQALKEGCRQLQVQAIPVLDPVIGALASYLGRQSHGVPGRQHLLDNEYFARIDAMTFAINHDDGQSPWGIDDADVCLVGVS